MWTPSRKAGGIPRVRTRLSLSVENEQADAERDGRTCLARPNSQARTGTKKKTYFPARLTTSRNGNHIRLIHTQLKVLTIHTVRRIVDIDCRQNDLFCFFGGKRDTELFSGMFVFGSTCSTCSVTSNFNHPFVDEM